MPGKKKNQKGKVDGGNEKESPKEIKGYPIIIMCYHSRTLVRSYHLTSSPPSASHLTFLTFLHHCSLSSLSIHAKLSLIITTKKKSGKLSASPSKRKGKPSQTTPDTTAKEEVQPNDVAQAEPQPQYPPSNISIEDTESENERKGKGKATNEVKGESAVGELTNEPADPPITTISSYEKVNEKVANTHSKIEKKEVREMDTSSKVARMLLRKRSSLSSSDNQKEVQQVQKMVRPQSTSDGLSLDTDHEAQRYE